MGHADHAGPPANFERGGSKVRKTIAAIADDASTTTEYPDALFDEQAQPVDLSSRSGRDSYTAFAGHKAEAVPGRLVVCRIADLNPKKATGQDALFDTWRFHAFSPPPTLTCATPSRLTRPTAPTRSSNRSTPT